MGQAIPEILSLKLKQSSKLRDFFEFFYFPRKSEFRPQKLIITIKKVQLFVYRGKKLIHSVRPTDKLVV